MRQGIPSVNVSAGHLPRVVIALCASLLALPPLAGCGGANTGSFVDQNGFPIGTPRGPAPTAGTRDAVRRILREIVPPEGSAAPTRTGYTFDGGYSATLVWKPGVTGSSGLIEGPTPGLPAVFQVSAVGITAQYADFTLEYIER